MNNHFNTPAETIELNMKACENKTVLPLGKMILLGIMAGAFIALGGAASSTAAHAIENVGLARAMAGVIFPVGLMLIVFLGGELFTGNCLIVMDVFAKRTTWKRLLYNLVVVYFSNLIGALIIDTLLVFSGNLNYSGGLLGAYTIKTAVGKLAVTPVQAITSGILCNLLVDTLLVFSGNLNYSGGLLGAYTIKTAVGKLAVTPVQAITSGILCNLLVCLAVLMATCAKDIVGKVWAIFFPICAFVIGGFEHCVANMFYIPAGMMAAANPDYAAMAQQVYGITAEQLAGLTVLGSLQNFIPVTIGNILGGMVFTGLPLYLIYKKKWD